MTSSQNPSDLPTAGKSHRWRIACACILILWIVSTILLSTTWFRAWLSYPLHVSNMTDKAEMAYVMSGGHAYWERLHAASDLYHMGQIQKVAIKQDSTTSQYDFALKRSQTRQQRAIRYLVALGVPENCIVTVSASGNTMLESESMLGSWWEAQAFAAEFPLTPHVVVSTSSPHTRRSLLCFQRAMPASCKVSVYAASRPEHGSELFNPIWLEYGKLAVYWLVAR